MVQIKYKRKRGCSMQQRKATYISALRKNALSKIKGIIWKPIIIRNSDI